MKKNIIAATLSAAMVAGLVPFAGAAYAVAAVPTRDKGQTVYVDNTRVYPTGYNIADNNYFKLRDIGKLVGFGVDYDEATQTVEISTTRTAPSTEGITDTSVSGAVAKISNQRIAVDGIYVNMKAYQIDGNNYVKLRDVGLQVNFGVNYDAANNRVVISPKLFYGEEVQESNTSKVTDEMLRQWELEMVDAINEERRKVGVPELEIDEDLMWSSGFWAEHLTTDFRHAEYGEIKKLADAQGITVRDDIEDVINGENIAGAVVPNDNPVTKDMKKFMASEGHRNTILNREWARVGIGFALSDNGQVFCCQHFGR